MKKIAGSSLPFLESDCMDYGSNVMLVAKTDECGVYKIENETGDGVMTIYEILPGIQVMYNDFHMEYAESDFEIKDDNWLYIDHCREGRMETISEGIGEKTLWANCLDVDVRQHHEGISRFPTSHFHGITIGFFLPDAQKSLETQFSGFPVSLEKLREKYCADSTPHIIEASKEIDAVFSQMYRLPHHIQVIYLRIKIIELLLYLDYLSLPEQEAEKTYFYRTDVEKARAIAERMEKYPENHYTISQLSDMYGTSESALKSCFKNEFGMPLYTYLQSCRIQKAAGLLIRQGNMKIEDAALAVGYESAGKFTAVFKKIMGVTPSEYKKHPFARPIGFSDGE